MLELSAAYPMYTEQRRAPNYYVPDAQLLFHTLGVCDQLMTTTDRFLRSMPSWLPIVSQLYVSVLWNVMILKVYVNTGYGAAYAHDLDVLLNHLQINECMIPGPLVPFFQSLAAVNGPFDWIGDIIPAMPSFTELWTDEFAPHAAYARQIPIPAILLDQLYRFATLAFDAQLQTNYATFEWYSNIFNQDVNTHNARLRLGPQLCGSLFTTQAQCDSARAFWNPAFANGFTRIDAANGPLMAFPQLLGFISQDGALQSNWFMHISLIMHKYAQYFNGSVPLKSISPVGIGASVIYGTPLEDTNVRDWLYPAAAAIAPFRSTRFLPRRELPATLAVRFAHADHEIEEQAEQYSILCHTNMKWYVNNATQNNHTAIEGNYIHQGEYWNFTPFRYSPPVSLKTQFAQVIASRYHQQAANRAE
jgi:hypothetical protein